MWLWDGVEICETGGGRGKGLCPWGELSTDYIRNHIYVIVRIHMRPRIFEFKSHRRPVIAIVSGMADSEDSWPDSAVSMVLKMMARPSVEIGAGDAIASYYDGVDSDSQMEGLLGTILIDRLDRTPNSQRSCLYKKQFCAFIRQLCCFLLFPSSSQAQFRNKHKPQTIYGASPSAAGPLDAQVFGNSVAKWLSG